MTTTALTVAQAAGDATSIDPNGLLVIVSVITAGLANPEKASSMVTSPVNVRVIRTSRAIRSLLLKRKLPRLKAVKESSKEIADVPIQSKVNLQNWKEVLIS